MQIVFLIILLFIVFKVLSAVSKTEETGSDNLSRHPGSDQSAERYYERGKQYLDQGEYHTAMNFFDFALAEQPNHHWAMYMKAVAAAEGGWKSLMLQSLEHAILLEPSHRIYALRERAFKKYASDTEYQRLVGASSHHAEYYHLSRNVINTESGSSKVISVYTQQPENHDRQLPLSCGDIVADRSSVDWLSGGNKVKEDGRLQVRIDLTNQAAKQVLRLNDAEMEEYDIDLHGSEKEYNAELRGDAGGLLDSQFLGPVRCFFSRSHIRTGNEGYEVICRVPSSEKRPGYLFTCVHKAECLLLVDVRQSYSLTGGAYAHEIQEDIHLRFYKYQDLPLPTDLFQRIQNGASKRDLGDAIIGSLRKWEVYLDIQERLSRESQFSLLYESYLRRSKDDRRLELNLSFEAVGALEKNIRAAMNETVSIFDSSNAANNAGEGFDEPLLVATLDSFELWNDGRSYRIVLLLDDDDIQNIARGSLVLPDKGTVKYARGGDIAQIIRQRDAIGNLRNLNAQLPNLHEIFFSESPSFYPIEDISVAKLRREECLQKDFINEDQIRAVDLALSTPDCFFLQGPPGTGKTTFIAELCFQLVRRGKRALVSSQANLAVDNALAKLSAHPDIMAIRLGNPRKVEEDGLPFVGQNAVRRWLRTLSMQSQEYLRSQIDKEGSTQVNAIRQAIVEDWTKELEQPNIIVNEALVGLFKRNANIVGSTCLYAGSRELKEFGVFDCVIVDEVSKATPIELLVPCLHGKKVVLVGDHKQLAPIVSASELCYSEAAEQLGIASNEIKSALEASFFEERYGLARESGRAHMLRMQYRMHSQIMNAINQFYEFDLKLGFEKMDEERQHGISCKKWLAPESHVVWISTPRSKEWRSEKTGKSRRNDKEAHLVLSVFDQVMPFAIDANLSVGITSVYGAQVRAIQRMIDQQRIPLESRIKMSLRVNSVDQFQGMEKDIMIVSLVLSDPKQRALTEFLRNPQRINVAFSRSRRLLIIVGSGSTFTLGQDKICRAYERVRDLSPRLEASDVLD